MKFENILPKALNSMELNETEKKMREIGLKGLIVALNSVLPDQLIKNNFSILKDSIIIAGNELHKQDFDEILIIGGGKASAEMAKEIITIIDQSAAERGINFKGIINIPHEQEFPSKIESKRGNGVVEINFSGHPIPDRAGLLGVKKMIELIQNASPQALIISLISGGGSALMPYPYEPLSLEDLQHVNKIMLHSGLDIHEINCIRKHLSHVKGGYLSKHAQGRKLFSFIISDVIGDDLQTIASGPTVPDKTTFKEAFKICEKYEIFKKLPSTVQNHLQKGLNGEIEETPKPHSDFFKNTQNIIIGSAKTSTENIIQYFEDISVKTHVFTHNLQGGAKDYGKRLYHKIINCSIKDNLIHAFIGTGEFTVTINGTGKGGRNQEMLLGFLNEWASEKQNQKHNQNRLNELGMNFLIISGAFDGIEGNSPALGAFIDNPSISWIEKNDLKKSIKKYLNNNDSYTFFKKFNQTIETGYTGTNVNDMTIIITKTKKEQF